VWPSAAFYRDETVKTFHVSQLAPAGNLHRRVCWLQASCLNRTLIGPGRNPKSFITFREPERRVAQFCEHPTFVFIKEIIGEQRAYTDTTLYARMMAGRRIVRQFSVDGRKRWTRVTTEADFVRYYNRYVALAEDIRQRGLLTINSEGAAPLNQRYGQDHEIRVGIDANGNFLHCRYGRHRLSIAKVLGVERVPVVVDFISGYYLLRCMQKREALIPRRLYHRIHAAIHHVGLRNPGSANLI
jgi:hypothetical protein